MTRRVADVSGIVGAGLVPARKFRFFRATTRGAPTRVVWRLINFRLKFNRE
ncbi:MAG: hypothetical protein ACK415_06165 [Thermodesulfovibrionales bacterium]